MLISLLGYMGSGKSHVAKELSQILNIPSTDLDYYIAVQNGMTLPEIFEKKGELYFRRQEKQALHEILKRREKGILSLGGGTAAYYDNMEIINAHSESVYLRAGVATLTQRLLKQKHKRPLIARIADEDLPEFVAKHLFERQPFYTQAKYTVVTDGKSPGEIAREIIALVMNP